MDVLIVGAGGLAREVLSIFRLDRNIEVVGFVDRDDATKGEAIDGVKILGNHSVLKLSYQMVYAAQLWR